MKIEFSQTEVEKIIAAYATALIPLKDDQVVRVTIDANYGHVRKAEVEYLPAEKVGEDD